MKIRDTFLFLLVAALSLKIATMEAVGQLQPATNGVIISSFFVATNTPFGFTNHPIQQALSPGTVTVGALPSGTVPAGALPAARHSAPRKGPSAPAGLRLRP